MTAIKTHLAQDLSVVLRKVLPVTNTVVDFYGDHAEWDQAVLEALATFAKHETPLPVDVREMVQDLGGDDAVHAKVRKRIHYLLDMIPE